MRLKLIIVGLTALLLCQTAMAEDNSSIAIQSLTVEPQSLFVGDSAIVTVTLYNPLESAVKVTSFRVQSYGVSYNSFDLGYIPPQSTHTHLASQLKQKKRGCITLRSHFTQKAVQ
ncbi:MAG: hypothetical protein H0Z19_09300 [Archaeoglobus sp.]|uniref:hypothetical protein n=1 Tax=Archaeoglobus sp. TaxID=1872626 RepID=UPI001DD65825|nr:hypothetical protein [Archaeoglobus sp.]MBO8180652.1 hypothetical protein [Archaeoglobus sp.]